MRYRKDLVIVNPSTTLFEDLKIDTSLELVEDRSSGKVYLKLYATLNGTAPEGIIYGLSLSFASRGTVQGSAFGLSTSRVNFNLGEHISNRELKAEYELSPSYVNQLLSIKVDSLVVNLFDGNNIHMGDVSLLSGIDSENLDLYSLPNLYLVKSLNSEIQEIGAVFVKDDSQEVISDLVFYYQELIPSKLLDANNRIPVNLKKYRCDFEDKVLSRFTTLLQNDMITPGYYQSYRVVDKDGSKSYFYFTIDSQAVLGPFDDSFKSFNFYEGFDSDDGVNWYYEFSHTGPCKVVPTQIETKLDPFTCYYHNVNIVSKGYLFDPDIATIYALNSWCGNDQVVTESGLPLYQSNDPLSPRFIGWSINQDCSTVDYEDFASIEMKTYIIPETGKYLKFSTSPRIKGKVVNGKYHLYAVTSGTSTDYKTSIVFETDEDINYVSKGTSSDKFLQYFEGRSLVNFASSVSLTNPLGRSNQYKFSHWSYAENSRLLIPEGQKDKVFTVLGHAGYSRGYYKYNNNPALVMRFNHIGALLTDSDGSSHRDIYHGVFLVALTPCKKDSEGNLITNYEDCAYKITVDRHSWTVYNPNEDGQACGTVEYGGKTYCWVGGLGSLPVNTVEDYSTWLESSNNYREVFIPDTTCFLEYDEESKLTSLVGGSELAFQVLEKYFEGSDITKDNLLYSSVNEVVSSPGFVVPGFVKVSKDYKMSIGDSSSYFSPVLKAKWRVRENLYYSQGSPCIPFVKDSEGKYRYAIVYQKSSSKDSDELYVPQLAYRLNTDYIDDDEILGNEPTLCYRNSLCSKIAQLTEGQSLLKYNIFRESTQESKIDQDFTLLGKEPPLNGLTNLQYSCDNFNFTIQNYEGHQSGTAEDQYDPCVEIKPYQDSEETLKVYLKGDSKCSPQDSYFGQLPIIDLTVDGKNYAHCNFINQEIVKIGDVPNRIVFEVQPLGTKFTQGESSSSDIIIRENTEFLINFKYLNNIKDPSSVRIGFIFPGRLSKSSQEIRKRFSSLGSLSYKGVPQQPKFSVSRFYLNESIPASEYLKGLLSPRFLQELLAGVVQSGSLIGKFTLLESENLAQLQGKGLMSLGRQLESKGSQSLKDPRWMTVLCSLEVDYLYDLS